jgi:signal transduction histidine kinase
MKKLMAVRARISRDLHDEVGSALSSIHVYSTVAARTLEKNPEASKDALQVINNNSRQVLENMSDIVWAINTGQQSEISLEKKLKNYGFELLTPLGIVTRYAIDHYAEQKLLQIEARKNILMIAKEAMNNIARYSKATEANIQLEAEDNQLHLHITDNGIGFDVNNKKPGNGLFNMKKRTESMAGIFVLDSTPGKGTSISCRIPLASISDN